MGKSVGGKAMPLFILPAYGKSGVNGWKNY
jgi:hypothetical protein